LRTSLKFQPIKLELLIFSTNMIRNLMENNLNQIVKLMENFIILSEILIKLYKNRISIRLKKSLIKLIY